MYLMIGDLMIDEIDGMNAAPFFKQEEQEEIVLVEFFDCSFSVDLVVLKAGLSLSIREEFPDIENGNLLFCMMGARSHGGKDIE